MLQSSAAVKRVDEKDMVRSRRCKLPGYLPHSRKVNFATLAAAVWAHSANARGTDPCPIIPTAMHHPLVVLTSVQASVEAPLASSAAAHCSQSEAGHHRCVAALVMVGRANTKSKNNIGWTARDSCLHDIFCKSEC